MNDLKKRFIALIAGLAAMSIACSNAVPDEIGDTATKAEVTLTHVLTPEKSDDANSPSIGSLGTGRTSHVTSRNIQAVEGGSEFLQTNSILITVRPRDTIPAILDPVFASRHEADDWMIPDELVLGIDINGDARAYPLKILGWHEIVNDTVGGEPVAVTW